MKYNIYKRKEGKTSAMYRILNYIKLLENSAQFFKLTKFLISSYPQGVSRKNESRVQLYKE